MNHCRPTDSKDNINYTDAINQVGKNLAKLYSEITSPNRLPKVTTKSNLALTQTLNITRTMDTTRSLSPSVPVPSSKIILYL